MSKEPLLLPSARSGIIITRQPHISPWWRRAAILFGLLVVIVGGADVVTRFSERALGSDVNFFAFGPAALITDPSLIEAVTGTHSSTATTTTLVPLYLRIPSIEVDALVEAVGKKPDGAMATPTNFQDIAWYAPGAKPGGAGNAVFAGHVNNALNMDGVFSRLGEVGVGDRIVVEGTHGERLTYEVKEILTYPANRAPTEEIFRTTGPSQIILITCDGEWDSLARSYDKRLVVVAQLSPL